MESMRYSIMSCSEKILGRTFFIQYVLNAVILSIMLFIRIIIYSIICITEIGGGNMAIVTTENILKLLYSYNPWWRETGMPKEHVRPMKRFAFLRHGGC